MPSAQSTRFLVATRLAKANRGRGRREGRKGCSQAGVQHQRWRWPWVAGMGGGFSIRSVCRCSCVGAEER